MAETVEQKNNDEFDLSDITAEPKEMSREDIIAAAEAAAFSEEQGRGTGNDNSLDKYREITPIVR